MVAGAISWPEIVHGLRLARGLPAFLRAPIDVGDARAAVARRLATRGEDFVRLVGRAVYGAADNPYRRLLEHIGCAEGDLARLVRADGLEGALAVLCRQGVYLTLDELKGRRTVVRGSLRLEVEPARLGNRNPAIAGGHVPAQSSGSRGAPASPVRVSLSTIAAQAIDQAVLLDARDDLRAAHAIWNVPGGAALEQMLWFGRCGVRPTRWFSQIDPGAAGLHPRYRWSVRVAYWSSRAGRRGLPWPEFVSLEDPRPIVRWMAETLRSAEIPHLWTYASAAVRVTEAATAAGTALAGARFTVSGEPVTPARLAAIGRSGADVLPRFGSSECGYIASGCLCPEAADDMHLLTDLHAAIAPPDEAVGQALAPDALLLSSIREDARLVLLNTSLGDRARIRERRCGCPLDRAGWTTHLRDVRSDARLTVGGMAVLDADVVRILETSLPERFGGNATDYQLVEEEADATGAPRLTLRVHPRLGPLEAGSVSAAFLEMIGGGAGADRIAALLWRAGEVVRVERTPPLATPGGKIRHRYLVVRP